MCMTSRVTNVVCMPRWRAALSWCWSIINRVDASGSRGELGVAKEEGDSANTVSSFKRRTLGIGDVPGCCPCCLVLFAGCFVRVRLEYTIGAESGGWAGGVECDRLPLSSSEGEVIVAGTGVVYSG